MTAEIRVRRARLADAEAIAAFVNSAQSSASNRQETTRLSVVERFSQVGFMVAERAGHIVGLLGWQIENLIVRVTDYLVAAPVVDAGGPAVAASAVVVARALVEKMEAEAEELQAESALLFLPTHPSSSLVKFWESLGYDTECLDDLPKVCREAVLEWGLDAERVMIKRLCKDPVRRPA